MDLELIRKLSEKRSGGLKKLAVDIGMTEQNLHRCIRHNKIQASDLEKIAMLLKTDISAFFDECVSAHVATAMATGDHAGASVSGNVTIGDKSESEMAAQIKLLQQLLDEKERTIQILLNR